MISLLHPTRQRPEKSLATCLKWLANAGTDMIELIISIDIDDPYIDAYRENFNKLDSMAYDVVLFTASNKSAIEAINRAARESVGDIMIVVSDDTDCPENWAVDLLKLMSGKVDWILKVDDGIQPWVITMPVMDRRYFNRLGYIYHEAYQHQFCDTELTCVADLTGRKVVTTMKFPHNHHSVTKSEPDEVSKKADATFEMGRQVFIERKRNNFGLSPDQIKGSLVDNVYSRMQ